MTPTTSTGSNQTGDNVTYSAQRISPSGFAWGAATRPCAAGQLVGFRALTRPGQIWTSADHGAEVNVAGRIKVRGRGLLLAGGNGSGTNAGQSVFATLICVAPDGPFTLHSTDSDDVTAGIQGVPLEANGDFRIDDFLSPAPPNPCVGPVLLIRNTAGAWFAAGIPKHDD